MTVLQQVEWLDPLVEPGRNKELDRYVVEQTGARIPTAGFFATCPWIMRADVDLDFGYVHLDGDLTALLYMAVSRDNSCRFCYGAARMLMRMGGMSERRIRKLEHDADSVLAPGIRLALDFARRVSRANPLPVIADEKDLRDAGYGEAAIRELAFYASEVVFHNRVYTLLALPPRFQERIGGSRLLVQLMRLRFRGLIERAYEPGGPEVLEAGLEAGPFANLVRALDGLPAARVLRKILDEAWASPHLPARTKALVFAVVARGLGSARAEAEAARLLLAAGLGLEEVEEILSHLASPALDPVETAILPYARETIWYQPADIQRRGRELAGRLSREQLLETVGIAGLANMVGRMAIVLDAA